MLPVLFLFLLICSYDREALKKEAGIDQYRRMYESGDWTVRKTAVTKASRSVTPEGTDFLIKATHDSHSTVQIEAITRLRRHPSPKSLERIRELAESSDNLNIRWHAIRTLGYYREPTAALIFAKNLKHEDWLIREESIKGLLKIDDYAIKYVSVPYIIEALQDPSTSVRLTTMKYLRVTDPRIYEKLAGILMNSDNRQQVLIEETLKALKGYNIDDKTREKVIGYLTHQNRDIRLTAYRVLLSQKEQAAKSKTPSR